MTCTIEPFGLRRGLSKGGFYFCGFSSFLDTQFALVLFSVRARGILLELMVTHGAFLGQLGHKQTLSAPVKNATSQPKQDGGHIWRELKNVNFY